MRLLLLYVTGATSFEDLRTINGVIHLTYEAAATSLNLVANDAEWKRCLEEVVLIRSSPELRLLFATICVYCAPTSPHDLWQIFGISMIDDINREFKDICQEDAINVALFIVKKLL